MENKNLPGYKTPRVNAYTDKESLDELGPVPTGYGRDTHFNTSCLDEQRLVERVALTNLVPVCFEQGMFVCV